MDGRAGRACTTRLKYYLGKQNDRFNNDRGGDCLVFCGTEIAAENVAVIVAHETGHLMGLRHVNPLPGMIREVMETPFDPDQAPAIYSYSAGKTPIIDPGESDDHNPRYHLLRHTVGVSHDELVSRGNQYEPGSWDLRFRERFKARLSRLIPFANVSLEVSASGSSAATTWLYDVKVLVRDSGEETATLIAGFAQFEISDLLAKDFIVDEGGRLVFIASSAPGVSSDMIVASGDPTVMDNVFIDPTDSSATLTLYQNVSGAPVAIEQFSAAAEPFVLPPPDLEEELEDDPVPLIRITFSSEPGYCYTLERNQSLAPNSWEAVVADFQAEGGTVEINLPRALGSSQAYYRVRASTPTLP
jgi:hypothetical protein